MAGNFVCFSLGFTVTIPFEPCKQLASVIRREERHACCERATQQSAASRECINDASCFKVQKGFITVTLDLSGLYDNCTANEQCIAATAASECI
jgi:hypothetical protein